MYKTKPGQICESKIMRNGLHATVIEYISSQEITIRFENGIEKKCTYGNFIKGYVKCPGVDVKHTWKPHTSIKKERIGENRIMNCGKAAKIIDYRGAADIDICFDDGTAVYHKEYASFIKGEIGYPKSQRVGEIRKMRCGLAAKIIEYRNSRDIDVLFTESGIVQKNKSYGNFKKGAIRPKQK